MSRHETKRVEKGHNVQWEYPWSQTCRDIQALRKNVEGQYCIISERELRQRNRRRPSWHMHVVSVKHKINNSPKKDILKAKSILQKIKYIINILGKLFSLYFSTLQPQTDPECSLREFFEQFASVSTFDRSSESEEREAILKR